MKRNKGISLIILIITIVVIIIIAGVVILELDNDNIIGKANEVKFKTDLGAFTSQLGIYLDIQHAKSKRGFNADTFNANMITTPKITDVIKSIDGAKNGDILYTDILEVRNGKLVLKDSVVDEDIAVWAQDLKLGKINIIKEESTNSLWEFDQDTRTITKYLGTVTNTLTIPNFIDGLAVASIQGSESQSIFQNDDYMNILEEIIVSEGITTIGDYAFENCKSLTNIIMPNGVTALGDSTFKNCDSLTSITIPNSITVITYDAFNSCDKLTNVVIPNGVALIEAYAFANCTILPKIIIPGSVTIIENYAFEGCEALSNLTLTNGLITLGARAFQNCYSLVNVLIPDSVTSIERGVFNNCNSLQNITVNSSNSTFCSIDGVVYTENKRELVSYPSAKVTSTLSLPAGVNEIRSIAFNGSFKLVNLTISDEIEFITESATDGCYYIQNYNVNANNPWLSSVNGVLFNKNQSELLIYPSGNLASSYTVPSSVGYISNYSFDACQKLTSVTVPSSVTFIDGGAFESCKVLTSITLPSSITRILYCTFELCTSLTNIVIPNSVKSIEQYAFSQCSNLTTVTIPSGLTKIEKYGFFCCYKLSSITIPSTVTTIGEYTFGWCDALSTITINKTNGSITGAPWGNNHAVITWTM